MRLETHVRAPASEGAAGSSQGFEMASDATSATYQGQPIPDLSDNDLHRAYQQARDTMLDCSPDEFINARLLANACQDERQRRVGMARAAG